MSFFCICSVHKIHSTWSHKIREYCLYLHIWIFIIKIPMSAIKCNSVGLLPLCSFLWCTIELSGGIIIKMDRTSKRYQTFHKICLDTSRIKIACRSISDKPPYIQSIQRWNNQIYTAVQNSNLNHVFYLWCFLTLTSTKVWTLKSSYRTFLNSICIRWMVVKSFTIPDLTYLIKSFGSSIKVS